MRMAADLLAWPQVTDCRANGKGGRGRRPHAKLAGDDGLFTVGLVSRQGGNVQGCGFGIAATAWWFGDACAARDSIGQA